MRSRWSLIARLAIVAVVVSTSTRAAGQTAGIFGVVGGVVEDPQHRPLPEADITLRAQLSDWRGKAQTGTDGQVSFTAVPPGGTTDSVTGRGLLTPRQT